MWYNLAKSISWCFFGSSLWRRGSYIVAIWKQVEDGYYKCHRWSFRVRSGDLNWPCHWLFRFHLHSTYSCRGHFPTLFACAFFFFLVVCLVYVLVLLFLLGCYHYLPGPSISKHRELLAKKIKRTLKMISKYQAGDWLRPKNSSRSLIANLTQMSHSFEIFYQKYHFIGSRNS